MVTDEAYYGMRRDTFLAENPIAPLENREAEKTEEEKARLCDRMIQLMYETKNLPD